MSERGKEAGGGRREYGILTPLIMSLLVAGLDREMQAHVNRYRANLYGLILKAIGRG